MQGDDRCPRGHQIRSTADRDRQGYCRSCRRDGARAYRVRSRAALELVAALERHGVEVTPGADLQRLAGLLAGKAEAGPETAL